MRGREQPAKRGGDRQAAGAARHRAQRAWFEGHAPAHLEARPTVLVHLVADAECCVHSLRTTLRITMITASSAGSEVSNGLPTIRDEEGHSQLAPSAVVQAARHMWLQQLRRLPHLSAGTRHRGHGRRPSFRQPSKAWWRRKSGSAPDRAHLEAPSHGEDDEANRASKRLRHESSTGGVLSDPVSGPCKTGLRSLLCLGLRLVRVVGFLERVLSFN